MAIYISKLFLNLLIFLSILICLSSGFPIKESVLPSKGETEFAIFKQWMKEHGKQYQNSETTKIRYQKFRKNLKYIIETNAKGLGYRLGLNEFADMSPEEFRRVFLRQLPMPASNRSAVMLDYVQQNDYCSPSDSLDWRQKGVVSPIKNQKKCGKIIMLPLFNLSGNIIFYYY